MPVRPAGPLRQGGPRPQPHRELRGHPAAALGPAAGLLLGEDGRDVTLYRLFAGDVCILSASCVLDAVTFDVHIDAEEPVEAYCIGAGAFKRVMDENIYVRCYAYQMTRRATPRPCGPCSRSCS